MNSCSIDKCVRIIYARGWCSMHWQRWWKHGNPLTLKILPNLETCDKNKCERKPRARGFCEKHYRRFNKYGDPKIRLVNKRDKICTKRGCKNKHDAKGFCGKHYRRQERINNVQYRISMNLRNRLNMALKNKQRAGSAVKDLGCSIEEFMMYISSMFEDGMSWDNWGHDTWHLDHIKPLMAFDLTNKQQFLVASNYTNYQPLWAKDNLSKGSSR